MPQRTVAELHAQQMIGAMYQQIWDFQRVKNDPHLLINLSRDTVPQVYRDIRVEPGQVLITPEGLAIACEGFVGFMPWERINALSGMIYYHLPEEIDAPQEITTA